MNIFVLDLDPQRSAEYHCDKHVVKMILEYAQLLCTAHHETGTSLTPPYRSTHKNHPCAIWTRQSLDNYRWLIKLAQSLCKEYSKRYGQERLKKFGTDKHATESAINWAASNEPNIPALGLTPFPLCMPDAYKTSDVVESYRNYYIGDKAPFAKWKTQIPDWFSHSQVAK